MKIKELCDWEGRGKKGIPKNAGITQDVYENKGPEKRGLGITQDVIENKQVICCNTDVYEKTAS